MKKLQPDKLEPKSEKCVFIGYPKETVGYTFYHRSEGKIFVAKNGSFLEKEFLSKEVSGRKVELHEVIVPAPLLESRSSQKSVPVIPTPISEEANDDDHETFDQVTTKLSNFGFRQTLEVRTLGCARRFNPLPSCSSPIYALAR